VLSFISAPWAGGGRGHRRLPNALVTFGASCHGQAAALLSLLRGQLLTHGVYTLVVIINNVTCDVAWTRIASFIFLEKAWSQDGWSYEKMLPMRTAYMGNVREKGFLRYFELAPSRYRAQLACLDMRTRPGRQVPISFSESLETGKKRINFFDDVFVSKH